MAEDGGFEHSQRQQRGTPDANKYRHLPMTGPGTATRFDVWRHPKTGLNVPVTVPRPRSPVGLLRAGLHCRGGGGRELGTTFGVYGSSEVPVGCQRETSTVTSDQDISAYRQHPVWASRLKLADQVGASAPRNSTDRETLARVSAILDVAKLYESANARLLPTTRLNTLNNMNTFFAQMSGQLDGWNREAGMAQATVNSIDQLCDQILAALSGFPQIVRLRTPTVSDADRAFQVAAEASLQVLEGDVVKVHEALRVARDEVQAVLTEAKSAREATDEAKVELETTLTTADERADAQLEKRLGFISERADAALQSAEQRSKELLTGLRERDKKATELLAHVADASVAGGYNDFADKELKAYRIWNAIGAGAATFAALYLVLHFWDLGHLSVQVTVFRAAISLPVLGFAAYAFQQAALRHRQSVEAKYRALDLVALPAFTDTMNEEQKSQLRMVLGERLFARSVEAEGNPMVDANGSPLAMTPQAIAELIKQFVK
jgi:hypothetical protein